MSYSITTHYLDCPLVVGRVYDIFLPDKISKNTSIFIVHGGGWRAGSKNGLHKIAEAFALRGYVVASTDYRLNAKDAFEQIQDIRCSYDRFVSFLKKNALPTDIAVYGESAGAHLASLLVCAAPGECGENVDLINEWIKPKMAMLQATPVDFLPWDGMIPEFWNTMQDIAGAPYEKDPERYERLSLKNYIRRDNPPILFLEAEFEHLFPSYLTKTIVEKHNSWGIKSFWKVYSKAEHGFFYNLTRNSQLEALEDICRFVDNAEI